MKFKSWKTMYEIIADCNDLYNRNSGVYIFVYNDAGALCYYSLSEEQAREVAIKAKKTGEYWGAHLGPGGTILDDTEYECFKYSNNAKEHNKYLKPSLDFCKEHFQDEGWVETDNAFREFSSPW